MSTFFMFGKYSQEALKGISSDRTKKAGKLVKEAGGKIKDIYALLGGYDLVIIAEFPSVEVAMKAAVALSKATGIAFSTNPAVAVEKFDKLMK